MVIDILDISDDRAKTIELYRLASFRVCHNYLSALCLSVRQWEH